MNHLDIAKQAVELVKPSIEELFNRMGRVQLDALIKLNQEINRKKLKQENLI